MPFSIVKENIVNMKTEAIVNAANNDLCQGSGVCGAVFKAAGANKLRTYCQAIGHCSTGKAVITPGGELFADYIIHTVGPVWHGGKKNEAVLLRDCYKNSLNLARENYIKSIAFPLISAGIYGYPLKAALTIAIKECSRFCVDNSIDVYLSLIDPKVIILAQKIDTYI
ncbi:macro domain-containing protein [Pectinatus sottacetonis]|uniref:macro domain-containing protein n=1 Tax=Pectinatus sottacetonis TaxID=1002795 RepID=UPI0018C4857B|nr:macro domain-containing protein [Pectinatus sottacetonis]